VGIVMILPIHEARIIYLEAASAKGARGNRKVAEHEHTPVPDRRSLLAHGRKMARDLLLPLVRQAPAARLEIDLDPFDRHDGDAVLCRLKRPCHPTTRLVANIFLGLTSSSCASTISISLEPSSTVRVSTPNRADAASDIASCGSPERKKCA